MRTALFASMILISLSGCFGGSDSGSASIYVKDAITDDFDELHVVFTAVTVHGTNGTGWVTVWQNNTGQDIDLMNASGNKAAFLGEADLEAGKYTQIRINATSVYGVKDGERIEISLANPSLKVIKPFTVGDEETRIVLDFDLDRSVKQQGQGGWKMTPVIGKTTVQMVDDDASGSDVHDEGEVAELSGIA